MIRLSMLGAAFLACVLTIPVAAQESPDTELAPAAVGDGQSTQHVEVLRGTIAGTTTAGGAVDLGTDSGTLSAAGHARVQINDLVIGLQGETGDVRLVGLPDREGGNGGSDSDVADVNGDGRIDGADLVAARIAALGDPASCAPTDTSLLHQGDPADIAAIRSGDRVGLVLICAGDNALTTAQRDAVGNNPVIVQLLAGVGLDASQVVGIRFEEGFGTLYVRAGR